MRTRQALCQLLEPCPRRVAAREPRQNPERCLSREPLRHAAQDVLHEVRVIHGARPLLIRRELRFQRVIQPRQPFERRRAEQQVRQLDHGGVVRHELEQQRRPRRIRLVHDLVSPDGVEHLGREQLRRRRVLAQLSGDRLETKGRHAADVTRRPGGATAQIRAPALSARCALGRADPSAVPPNVVSSPTPARRRRSPGWT
jgi:hypothetical protein